jgi:antitoxin component of MazEF toxin-antitoxin module
MEVPVKFEISVVLVGKSLKVTLPKEIARHVNLEKGDVVEMWCDDHQIIIQKKGR